MIYTLVSKETGLVLQSGTTRFVEDLLITCAALNAEWWPGIYEGEDQYYSATEGWIPRPSLQLVPEMTVAVGVDLPLGHAPAGTKIVVDGTVVITSEVDGELEVSFEDDGTYQVEIIGPPHWKPGTTTVVVT